MVAGSAHESDVGIDDVEDAGHRLKIFRSHVVVAVITVVAIAAVASVAAIATFRAVVTVTTIVAIAAVAVAVVTVIVLAAAVVALIVVFGALVTLLTLLIGAGVTVVAIFLAGPITASTTCCCAGFVVSLARFPSLAGLSVFFSVLRRFFLSVFRLSCSFFSSGAPSGCVDLVDQLPLAQARQTTDTH